MEKKKKRWKYMDFAEHRSRSDSQGTAKLCVV